MVKYTQLTTPKGRAIYPWISPGRPDTKFNADGEYRVTVRVREDDPKFQELLATLEGMLDEHFKTASAERGKKKTERASLPVAPAVDSETQEPILEDGVPLIDIRLKAPARFKNSKTGETWANTVPLFDGRPAPIKDPNISIGAGSTIKVSFEPRPYLMESTKQAGLSLRMIGVQVLTLKEPRNSAAGMGFDSDDEAYVHDEQAAPVSGFTAEAGADY